jgi:hypothetical protein
MIHPSDIGARRFAHQAMNTEFEIFCAEFGRSCFFQRTVATISKLLARFRTHSHRNNQSSNSRPSP